MSTITPSLTAHESPVGCRPSARRTSASRASAVQRGYSMAYRVRPGKVTQLQVEPIKFDIGDVSHWVSAATALGVLVFVGALAFGYVPLN